MYDKNMSEEMYNKNSNWKETVSKYQVDNDKEIKGFFFQNRWLSNFYKCDVWYEGNLYPSSENAYMAAKVTRDNRCDFMDFSPVAAKKNWKNYPLIDKSTEEWDNRKYGVMAVILFDKVFRNINLRQKLIDTGDKYLEEKNHFKDVYWGVDIKLGGQNNLGKILMKIRDFWK